MPFHVSHGEARTATGIEQRAVPFHVEVDHGVERDYRWLFVGMREHVLPRRLPRPQLADADRGEIVQRSQVDTHDKARHRIVRTRRGMSGSATVRLGRVP